MKVHHPSLLNYAAKAAARPLSWLIANRMMETPSRLAEAYWCVLLGKGAGTGWAMDAEIRAAVRLIDRPDPIVLDVGANTGEWSARLLKAVPGARLLLCEPQPACQAAIRQRELPHAELIPQAISDCEDEARELFTSGATSGIASLHQRDDTCFDGLQFATIEVLTTTIDRIVETRSLDRIDFLKMDIEGHELHALHGARQSLAEGRIRALSFEFGTSNVNSRSFFRDFWNLLTPLGYKIYRVLPSARLMPIREYYEDCEYFRGVTNYVARLA